MKYAQIRKYDIANGVGIRTSVFVSGCTHNCFNCFNKDYQNFEYGNEFTQRQIDEIISYMSEDEIAGLTILGGEPLQQNYDDMIDFLKQVRNATKKVYGYIRVIHLKKYQNARKKWKSYLTAMYL